MQSNYNKDMYRQMEELFSKVESLTAMVERMTAEKKADKKRIRELENTVKKLTVKTERQESELQKKDEELLRLKKEVAELTKNNAILQEEVTRLKSEKNNNSSNSSNPPSKDQKSTKKANEYNSRTKTGRKRGGQTGHKGTTLTKEKAEELIASGSCKHTIKEHGEKSNGAYTTKYELDITVEAEVIEHRIYGNSGAQTLPDSEAFYGARVKALVAMLYSVGAVSVKRIQDIISSITDGILDLSSGAIYGFFKKLAEQAKESLKKIETHIMDGTVAYTDATVITVDGKQAYIRNVSNQDAVRYYAMSKKDLKTLGDIHLLARFAGTLVHDHETSLYHFGIEHGECNVHLIRYLLKNTEDCSTTWSGKLTELLYEMKKRRDELVENSGETQLPESEYDQFFHRYDEIIAEGRRENQATKPKWAKQEENALLNRLEKYKTNHLLFLRNFEVAFSNNMSERDLRKCKNRQKLIGGFRSTDGATLFADILSLVETAKRQKKNVFDTILGIFRSCAPAFDFSMG